MKRALMFGVLALFAVGCSSRPMGGDTGWKVYGPAGPEGVAGLDGPGLRRRAVRRRVLHIALGRHILGMGLGSHVQLCGQRQRPKPLRQTRLVNELNDPLLRSR